MTNTATSKWQLQRELKGTQTACEALSPLLRESGLSYAETGDRVRVTLALRPICFKPWNSGRRLSVCPDIAPSDLTRVEVLRGPQGTLYGTSGLGGLINFFTFASSINAGHDYHSRGRVHASTPGLHRPYSAQSDIRLGNLSIL